MKFFSGQNKLIERYQTTYENSINTFFHKFHVPKRSFHLHKVRYERIINVESGEVNQTTVST